jgi:hypothetical protein
MGPVGYNTSNIKGIPVAGPPSPLIHGFVCRDKGDSANDLKDEGRSCTPAVSEKESRPTSLVGEEEHAAKSRWQHEGEDEWEGNLKLDVVRRTECHVANQTAKAAERLYT